MAGTETATSDTVQLRAATVAALPTSQSAVDSTAERFAAAAQCEAVEQFAAVEASTVVEADTAAAIVNSQS